MASLPALVVHPSTAPICKRNLRNSASCVGNAWCIQGRKMNRKRLKAHRTPGNLDHKKNVQIQSKGKRKTDHDQSCYFFFNILFFFRKLKDQSSMNDHQSPQISLWRPYVIRHMHR